MKALQEQAHKAKLHMSIEVLHFNLKSEHITQIIEHEQNWVLR